MNGEAERGEREKGRKITDIMRLNYIMKTKGLKENIMKD